MLQALLGDKVAVADINHDAGKEWRFRVYVDGGISPNGVGWEIKLPATATMKEVAEARAAMEAALKEFQDASS